MIEEINEITIFSAENESRTDKIGASNHLEMIDDIIEGLNIHTVTGTGLDKDAADANKESLS